MTNEERLSRRLIKALSVWGNGDAAAEVLAELPARTVDDPFVGHPMHCKCYFHR